MGRKPDLTEEEQQLKDLIREAHEAVQALRDAIRQADRLADRLVADFEVIHAREIKQLSNFFTEESNRHAAGLNADVERAKDMIFNQIMAGDLVVDFEAGTVSLKLGNVRFDDQQPPPFLQVTRKEKDQ